MLNIIEKLQAKPDFQALSAATIEQIEEAERALGLKFADDYREYVSMFGAAFIYGHEFTGISIYPRLNVVAVTADERLNNPAVPPDLYVLEQAHIDGIVIWQSGSGEIYQTAPNTPPEKICGSLEEYIDM